MDSFRQFKATFALVMDRRLAAMVNLKTELDRGKPIPPAILAAMQSHLVYDRIDELAGEFKSAFGYDWRDITRAGESILDETGFLAYRMDNFKGEVRAVFPDRMAPNKRLSAIDCVSEEGRLYFVLSPADYAFESPADVYFYFFAGIQNHVVKGFSLWPNICSINGGITV